MKSLCSLLATILITIFIWGCGGGGGGAANIQGPELSLSEAQQLEINHIYVKEWIGETRPFFTVYIQDAISEDYIVCAGPDQGLDIASSAGVYYGKLSVPMVAVSGTSAKETPLFNIIIVADQDEPCPKPIAEDDLIIGTIQVNFGELLDTPINIGDGAAYLALRGRGHEDIDIPEMGPAPTDALTVGEVYFQDSPPGDKIPDYYLVLYVSDGSSFEFHSIIDPSEMPEMREPEIIYSWLDLAFADTDGISTDEDLLKTKARVEFLRDDAQEVGKTEPEYLGDVIGRAIEFSNGKGYIKFRKLSN